MKLEQIFNEFIQVITDHNIYTIGLLDRAGRITYCSAEGLIGKDIAQIQDAEDLFYPVIVRDVDYGILWVNSEDNNKEMVGPLLVESLQTRIAYEASQEDALKTISLDEELLKSMISESTEDRKKFKKLARLYGLDTEVSRVCIIIKLSSSIRETVELTRLKFFTENKDVLYMKVDDYLVMYLGLSERIKRNEMKNMIIDFIVSLQEWGLHECKFFVGSVQTDENNYASSYKHSYWLYRYHEDTVNSQETIFFDEAIFSYLIGLVPQKEKKLVLNNFIRAIDKLDKKEFLEVSQALYQNDFNITKTAEALYIHKNTLLYKIKKYEETLFIDIRNTFKGK